MMTAATCISGGHLAVIMPYHD